MPLPVLSIAQMREWEKATWATGQSEAEVIRRVGECVAQHAMAMTQADALVLILAGKGNNGADARAARALMKGRRVDVLEVTSPADDLSKLETELSLRPTLIIDGLFGIGLNRPLAAEWCAFIEAVNRAGRPVLSVDVPSGLNADNGEAQGAAIQATVTLTVGAPKLGLLQSEAATFVGRLEVASEVGLASNSPETDVRWTVEIDFRDFPPRRVVGTHKGSY